MKLQECFKDAESINDTSGMIQGCFKMHNKCFNEAIRILKGFFNENS